MIYTGSLGQVTPVVSTTLQTRVSFGYKRQYKKKHQNYSQLVSDFKSALYAFHNDKEDIGYTKGPVQQQGRTITYKQHKAFVNRINRKRNIRKSLYKTYPRFSNIVRRLRNTTLRPEQVRRESTDLSLSMPNFGSPATLLRAIDFPFIGSEKMSIYLLMTELFFTMQVYTPAYIDALRIIVYIKGLSKATNVLVEDPNDSSVLFSNLVALEEIDVKLNANSIDPMLVTVVKEEDVTEETRVYKRATMNLEGAKIISSLKGMVNRPMYEGQQLVLAVFPLGPTPKATSLSTRIIVKGMITYQYKIRRG